MFLWLCTTQKSIQRFQQSGQIIIVHQPSFPWNKKISLTKPPFGVRSCEVAIIWPEQWFSLLGFLKKHIARTNQHSSQPTQHLSYNVQTPPTQTTKNMNFYRPGAGVCSVTTHLWAQYATCGSDSCTWNSKKIPKTRLFLFFVAVLGG